MSFIFQAVPDRYDLGDELRAGRRVSWVASRYRNRMKKGEVVYFWQAGDPISRGLYGWGVIVGDEPQLRKGAGYRVDVEYVRDFAQDAPEGHIPSDRIRQDPALHDHLIFRMPIGTNFVLSDEEDQAIRTIIAGEIGPDSAPPLSKPLESD